MSRALLDLMPSLLGKGDKTFAASPGEFAAKKSPTLFHDKDKAALHRRAAAMHNKRRAWHTKMQRANDRNGGDAWGAYDDVDSGYAAAGNNFAAGNEFAAGGDAAKARAAIHGMGYKRTESRTDPSHHRTWFSHPKGHSIGQIHHALRKAGVKGTKVYKSPYSHEIHHEGFTVSKLRNEDGGGVHMAVRRGPKKFRDASRAGIDSPHEYYSTSEMFCAKCGPDCKCGRNYAAVAGAAFAAGEDRHRESYEKQKKEADKLTARADAHTARINKKIEKGGYPTDGEGKKAHQLHQKAGHAHFRISERYWNKPGMKTVAKQHESAAMRHWKQRDNHRSQIDPYWNDRD